MQRVFLEWLYSLEPAFYRFVQDWTSKSELLASLRVTFQFVSIPFIYSFTHVVELTSFFFLVD